MICTFLGHRNCPREIEPILRRTLIDLIENKDVHKFYVGNHGGFDLMVHRLLKELVRIYSIEYDVVLTCVPGKKFDPENDDPENTILPEGIESVPPRFAITWRNRWMIKQSDYVITYVQYSCGGAAKFKELAERQNKIIINLEIN